jgi:glycosyltransferase involved in cell wall biosynthesis
VDYNFLNWYRTQIADVPEGKIWVIPNFVDIPNGYKPDMQRHQRKPVKIIFARRFVEERGSRLMIEAAKRLLKMFQEIEFCFAGEGPDQSLITETFENEPRVSIQKYRPDESLRIHEKFHIAVVPSLASEGTSLSLAEAMAAGCAVVATNVGGMTNMVIHEHNGCLVNPDVESLTNVLSRLINDRNLRIKLGEQAAATARDAFSLDRWKLRWSEVLDQIQKN